MELMEVEAIEFLHGAGYTQSGLWRVRYKNRQGVSVCRHYARHLCDDELAAYQRFMEEQADDNTNSHCLP